MASVSATVDVAAGPQQVWNVLVDPSRYDEWLDMHQGFVGDPPAAFTQGLSFGERVKVLGMPADVRWTVKDLEEPRRLALSGTGPMGIALGAGYGLEQSGADGATRVTVTMEFTGAALMMVGSQLESEVASQLRASLEKFKRVAEA
jgi:carbon monoxide dehydrogenase subunit G